MQIGREPAGGLRASDDRSPPAVDLHRCFMGERSRGRGCADAADQLFALAGVAVIESHAEAVVVADRLVDQSGHPKRAPDPAGDCRAALHDTLKARATPVKRGFDEQRAHALHRHGINQELAAVGDPLQEVRLQNAAILKSTDRRGRIAPIALHQPPHCPRVRRYGPSSRKQAVARMPTRGERHDRTADERSKRGIGGASCLEGGQLSCRHHFNDGRSESTHLPLLALQLGEPLIEACGAQVWLHRKHTTQGRYKVSVATQQCLYRLVHIGRAGLELLSVVRFYARSPQQRAAERGHQSDDQDRAGKDHPPSSALRCRSWCVSGVGRLRHRCWRLGHAQSIGTPLR